MNNQIIAKNGIPVKTERWHDPHLSKELSILYVGDLTTSESLWNNNSKEFHYKFTKDIGYYLKDMPVGTKGTLVYCMDDIGRLVKRLNECLYMGEEGIRTYIESRIKRELCSESFLDHENLLSRINEEQCAAYIMQVEIPEAFRGSGIIEALIDGTLWDIEWRRKDSSKIIWAMVRDSNKKQKQIMNGLKKMGFKHNIRGIEYEDMFGLDYSFHQVLVRTKF